MPKEPLIIQQQREIIQSYYQAIATRSKAEQACEDKRKAAQEEAELQFTKVKKQLADRLSRVQQILENVRSLRTGMHNLISYDVFSMSGLIPSSTNQNPDIELENSLRQAEEI